MSYLSGHESHSERLRLTVTYQCKSTIYVQPSYLEHFLAHRYLLHPVCALLYPVVRIRVGKVWLR